MNWVPIDEQAKDGKYRLVFGVKGQEVARYDYSPLANYDRGWIERSGYMTTTPTHYLPNPGEEA